MYTQPLRSLSGGQRARVVLSRLANSLPDLLLLDEPSNHLASDASQALIGELAAYNGAVLFASHDQVRGCECVLPHKIMLTQHDGL